MTALIDARVPLALVTSAPIALMRVRMEEAGVPEAGSHVPRIADFTGITFTIHERRAGHVSRAGTLHAAGRVSFRAGPFDAVGDSNPVTVRATCHRPEENAPARAESPHRRALVKGMHVEHHRAGHFSRPPTECLEDDARSARLGME